MRPALDLRANDIALVVMDDDADSEIPPHGDQSRHPLAALQREDPIAHRERFDRLGRAVGHLDQGATLYAEQVMRPALVVPLAPRMLYGPKLDDTIARNVTPDQVLAVELAVALEKLPRSIEDASQLAELSPEDDRPSVLGPGHAEQPITFAAACTAPITDDVGRTVDRPGLRRVGVGRPHGRGRRFGQSPPSPQLQFGLSPGP